MQDDLTERDGIEEDRDHEEEARERARRAEAGRAEGERDAELGHGDRKGERGDEIA